jgi:hypothetical protein
LEKLERSHYPTPYSLSKTLKGTQKQVVDLSEKTVDAIAMWLKSANQYFIEWTAPEMDIDAAAELVDLERILSKWKLNWENIWSDTTLRTQVAKEAESWSQRVLDMSGLLNEPPFGL